MFTVDLFARFPELDDVCACDMEKKGDIEIDVLVAGLGYEYLAKLDFAYLSLVRIRGRWGWVGDGSWFAAWLR